MNSGSTCGPKAGMQKWAKGVSNGKEGVKPGCSPSSVINGKMQVAAGDINPSKLKGHGPE